MPLLRGPYNARPPAGAAPHSGGRRRKRAGLELLLRNPLFFLIFAVRVSQKFCRATIFFHFQQNSKTGTKTRGRKTNVFAVLTFLCLFQFYSFCIFTYFRRFTYEMQILSTSIQCGRIKIRRKCKCKRIRGNPHFRLRLGESIRAVCSLASAPCAGDG